MHPTGVCEQIIPPENNILLNIGLQSAKSGARTHFLPLGCMAKACTKDSSLLGHRYHSPCKRVRSTFHRS